MLPSKIILSLLIIENFDFKDYLSFIFLKYRIYNLKSLNISCYINK